jgi:hypothetical protein
MSELTAPAVLAIGIIMTISGIVIFIIGYRRSIPNALLWSLFPFLHGLHEFADYALEVANAPFVVERFELVFAFASSFALIAAAIEYNGAIPKPAGRMGFAFGTVTIAFLFFALSEEVIEEAHETIFSFGLLSSEPFRFFYGFFSVLLAAIAFLGTYLFLAYQAKKGLLSIERRLTQTTIVSVVLLVIFSIFEGFEGGSAYIILRAIFMALFVIIPGYIVLYSKLGLQRLMVIDHSGILIYGYNFTQKTCIFCEEADAGDEEEAVDVLTAGFLAAISDFTGEILHIGKTFSIRTNRLYFVLTKSETKLFVLQSINYDKNLEKRFFSFIKSIQNDMEKYTLPSEDINDKFTPLVIDAFTQFA